MAKTLANYDPLVQIPSGMTPAGADFPIVESHDILVGENDKRLDAKLDDIDSAIGNVGQTPIATQLSSKVNTGDIVTSVAATGSTSNNKIPSETAVRAAIEAKTINVDSTVTQGSTNAVSGGAVHTQLATKQDMLTFDTTPTASSSNPVTSGGVKTALDTKQDALTFDTTPTASSSNPVTSGGVKAALDNKQNTLTYETTPIVGSVNPVTSTGIRNAIDTAAAQNLGAMQAQYDEFVTDAEDVLDRASSLSNGMVACSNIDAETTVGDTRILLYTGTTNSTYTNGHWYYNSAASNAAPSWTDGGAVGSAPTIDSTLAIDGAAANSKAVGDAIENIVTISNTQPGSNSGNKVWIRETTNEEVQVPTYAEHIAKANKADIVTNNESDNGSGTISASKAYAIGDHFYINNTNTSSENYGVSTLYKATAAIASGDAIVVGTNCEASKVADEITSLSNDIDTVKADLGAVESAMFVDVSWSDLGLTWEQGGYNANNGTRATASATSIRCPNIPKSVFSKIEKIRCAEGYKLTLLGYDSNGYLGFWKNGTAFAKSSLSSGIWYNELDITQFADLEYISLRSNRSDGANIVPADASNVIPTMRANDSSFIIDNTLSDADKAAGALETGTRIEAIKTDIYKTYPLGQVGGVTFGNGNLKLNDGTRNNSIKYVLYSNYIPKFIKELHVSSEGLTAGYFMRLYAYDDKVYQGCWNGSSFIKSGTPANLTDIVFANFADYDYKIILHCGSVYGSDETAPLTEANKVSALCIDYKVPEDVTISPADYQGREICTFNKILCIGDSLMTGSTNHPTGIAPNQENAKRTVVNSMYSIPTFLTKMYGVETTAWGISGATTRSWYNSKSSDDWSGYDAALVRLGNNDYTYGTSDDVDYDGAAAISDQYMKLIIAKLKADNPGIRIFLSTLSVSNLTDRLSAWRIPLMEKYRQIAADDDSVFIVDTAIYANYRASGGYYSGHPTALGYQLMAQDYGSMISYIMHNDPASFKWIQTVGTAYAVTDYSEAGDEEDVG